MFQFRRFPAYTYGFSIRCTDIVRAGCPIRIPTDISLAYSSPWLFAVNRVLLRLPVPRHSPCALSSLTFFCDPLLEILSSSQLSKNIVFHYPIFPSIRPFQDGRSYCSRFVCFSLFSFQGTWPGFLFKIRISTFKSLKC